MGAAHFFKHVESAPPAIERRRAVRRPLKAPAMLRGVAGASHVLVVEVCDVSELGVGFHTMIPLEIGSVHRFDICDRQMRRPGARAEVRSCRMVPGGGFHIGAQFC